MVDILVSVLFVGGFGLSDVYVNIVGARVACSRQHLSTPIRPKALE